MKALEDIARAWRERAREALPVLVMLASPAMAFAGTLCGRIATSPFATSTGLEMAQGMNGEAVAVLLFGMLMAVAHCRPELIG